MCEDLLARPRHHADQTPATSKTAAWLARMAPYNGAGARAQEQGQDRGDRITRARYVVDRARGHSLDNTAER